MMIKAILTFFIIFTVIGLFGDIYSNFPFNQIYRYDSEVSDARAEALGRCSILCSSGSNYLFNNPAYLSNLSKQNFRINGRAAWGREKHDYSRNYIKIEKKLNLKLSGISYAMPLYISKDMQTKIGVGLGYRTYYDLSSNNDYKYDLGDDQEAYKSKNMGGYSCITFGSGIKRHNNFNLGFSVNLPLMSNYIEKFKSEVGHECTNEGLFSGVFWTFSGAYDLNESIKIASRVRSGFNLHWKYKGDDDSKKYLKVPWELGMALSIKTRNESKIYFEYVTRNYSKYEIKGNYHDNKPFEDLPNGFSLRTGLESGKKIMLRRGLFWQSLPIYQDEKAQMELGVTGGLGFSFKKNFSFDISGSIAFVNFDDSIYNYDEINVFTFTNYKIGTTVGYDF